MTTNLDVIDILFAHLDAGPLKSQITGTICKIKRDGNSKKEDVVINCLPVNNLQLQRPIANVNIHVPDLKVSVNDTVDSQPDITRLKQLEELAVAELDEVYQANYSFGVQQTMVMDDPEAGDHYLNIRIEFFIENI